MKQIVKIERIALALLLTAVLSPAWAVSEDTGMLDSALANSSTNSSAQNNLRAKIEGQVGNPNALGGSIAANPNTVVTPAAPPATSPTNSVPNNLLAPPPITVSQPDAAPVISNAGVADQAFSNMARSLMPLTPDQIRMLHYLFDQSRKSAAEAPALPPKPTSSSVVVNLSPGATPPVIRLAAGFVTSLVFLDTTGAAWPIHAYDLGDPKGFNIQWNKKSNTLLVQASDSYKSGNLAVMLEGLNTPVMLTLLPGQQAIDYRVDLRVPGLGPNALTLVDETPGQGDPQLLNVLDGIPPAGGKQVEVLGGECQAWLSSDGHLFLRTRLTVLSPGWISLMTSADGMHAYEIPKTPVVLASSRGKVVQLSLQGL
ncbi:MAG TPA: DotH/IcmK family type IV secretion protein [Coxiellaceae bacterium]|nr:DotH/IcmK family type IV secretion protein [Coxiellaceae bacterium]